MLIEGCLLMLRDKLTGSVGLTARQIVVIQHSSKLVYVRALLAVFSKPIFSSFWFGHLVR